MLLNFPEIAYIGSHPFLMYPGSFRSFANDMADVFICLCLSPIFLGHYHDISLTVSQGCCRHPIPLLGLCRLHRTLMYRPLRRGQPQVVLGTSSFFANNLLMLNVDQMACAGSDSVRTAC